MHPWEPESVVIVLSTTLESIPQSLECSRCLQPMELSYFDYELGVRFMVRTQVPGHVCLNCGSHVLNTKAISEALIQSRLIMVSRGLIDELATIDTLIARREVSLTL